MVRSVVVPTDQQQHQHRWKYRYQPFRSKTAIGPYCPKYHNRREKDLVLRVTNKWCKWICHSFRKGLWQKRILCGHRLYGKLKKCWDQILYGPIFGIQGSTMVYQKPYSWYWSRQKAFRPTFPILLFALVGRICQKYIGRWEKTSGTWSRWGFHFDKFNFGQTQKYRQTSNRPRIILYQSILKIFLLGHFGHHDFILGHCHLAIQKIWTQRIICDENYPNLFVGAGLVVINQFCWRHGLLNFQSPPFWPHLLFLGDLDLPTIFLNIGSFHFVGNVGYWK